MLNSIKSSFSTVRQRFVRNINSTLLAIEILFWDPFCNTLNRLFFAFGNNSLYNSVSTHCERVLTMLIALFRICKTNITSLPLFASRQFLKASHQFVIVYNILKGIDIPLPWKKHICSGILQHWNQERNNIALGIKILYSLKDTCPLPLPSLQRLLIVPAVALPQGKVASVKTVSNLIWKRHVLNQNLWSGL